MVLVYVFIVDLMGALSNQSFWN